MLEAIKQQGSSKRFSNVSPPRFANSGASKDGWWACEDVVPQYGTSVSVKREKGIDLVSRLSDVDEARTLAS
jgi:hypothetical protein